MSERLSRHLLAALWLSLFLVGCLAQVDLLQGPRPGVDEAGSGALYTKKPVTATGTWEAGPDGQGRLTLSLAPLGADPVRGRFRVQDVVTSQINQIRARITGPGITTPIVPSGADAAGLISPSANSGLNLSFGSIPSGAGRILTVEGLHDGVTVAGAVVRTLFDMRPSDGGAFEVSQATTPAALLYQSLPATVAAVVTAAELNALADQITGRVGDYPTYTFTTHPSLVDIASASSALTAASGSTVGLTPASFRMPGATVSATFRIGAAGSPTANDQVTVWMNDPASSPLVLPHHTANTPTVSATTGAVAYTIHADNQVEVAFSGIPPSAAGTPWSLGASLPTDGSTQEHAAYYANEVSPGHYSCGTIGTATVSQANAVNAQPVTPTSLRPLLDPKFVAGQIRWRDNSLPVPIAANYESDLAGLIASMGASSSTDRTIHVGPTTAAMPSYSLGANADLGAAGAALAGPPPGMGFAPPVIAGNGTVTLGGADTGISGVALHGTPVQIGNGGGYLHNLSISAISGGGTTVAAVTGSGSGAISLADVHIYDVTHTGSYTDHELVAGIYLGGSLTGSLDRVRVDDNLEAGAAMAVRPNDTAIDAAGIVLTDSVSLTVSNSQASRIGYAADVPANTPMNLRGIISRSQQPVTVSHCTVAQLNTPDEATGIEVAVGTVADCEVRQTRGLQPYADVTGISAGASGVSGTVTIQDNFVHDLGQNGDATYLTAIRACAPPGTASLHVAHNTIQGCTGENFTGIDVHADGLGTETIIVANNVLAHNSNENGTGGFCGISLPAEQANNSRVIQGNDLSYNTGYTSFCGIITGAEASTMQVISGNNIAHNSLHVETNGSSPNWYLIDAFGGQGPLTVSNNLIRNNTVSYGNGATTGTFVALHTKNMVTGAAPQITNNLITGNTLNLTSWGLLATMIHAETTAGVIRSNRITDTGLVGSFANLSSWRAIVYEADAASPAASIDHNLVYEPAMGRSTGHGAMALSHASGGFYVQHNSVYVGYADYPTVVCDPSSSWAQLDDNVLSAGTYDSGLVPGAVDTGGVSVSGTSNSIYTWTAPAYSGATPVSLTADRICPNRPFVLPGLGLIAGEKPPTPGTSASEGASIERGVFGGTGLQGAPTFTSTVTPP
jgi:hypothetical protein